MIYAMLNQQQADTDRLVIALAIHNRDPVIIQAWVTRGIIVHVTQANSMAGPFYCIYCRDAVDPSEDRPPRGLTAANPWHFEHDNIADCIGHMRTRLPHTPWRSKIRPITDATSF